MVLQPVLLLVSAIFELTSQTTELNKTSRKEVSAHDTNPTRLLEFAGTEEE